MVYQAQHRDPTTDLWYKRQFEKSGVSWYETTEEQQELTYRGYDRLVYFPPGKKQWFIRFYNTLRSHGFTSTEITDLIKYDEYVQDLVWGAGWREWDVSPYQTPEDAATFV